MGLDLLAASFILNEHKYRPIKGRILTIGRQSIGVVPHQMDRLMASFDIPKRPGHEYRPEGSTVGVVRTGDMITLDVAERRLQLHVDDAELARRRAAWTPPPEPMERGYVKLYVDHVLQANDGVDLDFLVGRSGAKVPRDNH